MSDIMTNMRIYSRSRHVPDEAKKNFNNGKFSGTDINPVWRIKKLTELFGPAGFGWYYDVVSERSERLTDDTVIAIVDLNLYVRDGNEWSKPIFGTGGNQLVSKTKNGISTSDEGYKMALTDALSVACKALGIGADVYWDRDNTKYIKMATYEQLKFIWDHADKETLKTAIEHFGEYLWKMTYGQAIKLINRIEGVK